MLPRRFVHDERNHVFFITRLQRRELLLVSGTCIFEVAHKLLGVIRTPYPALDGDSPVSASFGVAIFPVDAQEQQTLLAHADSAMYRAKTSVENRVVFYRPPAADVAGHNRKLDVAAAIDAAKGALPATEPPADM